MSVIVPHYSDLKGLDACLTAIKTQRYPAEQVEVIVADNNSPLGRAAVEALVAGRASVVVVTEKGAGPARNGGAAVATGEILAFTDSDCLPRPDWLERGVAAATSYDVVGGRVDVFVANRRGITPTEAFDVVFGFDNEAMVRDKRFTVTANMFCWRQAFERAGGFRNGVSEDVEWSHRALAGGLTLGYADDAIVEHPPRKTWTELRAKWVRVDSETFELHRLYGHSRMRWLLRCLVLPFSAAAHAPRLMACAKLPFGARILGVGMLFRIRAWRAVNGLRLLISPPPIVGAIAAVES